MKKILFVIAILLGIGIMSSCNKNNASSNDIIGSWECERVYNEEEITIRVGGVYTFESGGTFLIDGFPAAQYRYDEQTGLLRIGASGEFYVQSITATKMIWNGPYTPGKHFADFKRVK